MLEREKLISTYIGMGVAISHGESSFKDSIIKSGIILLKVKDGIDFGSEKAYLIFAMAGLGNDHIKILSNIAMLTEDRETIENIINANSKNEIINIISRNINLG